LARVPGWCELITLVFERADLVAMFRWIGSALGYTAGSIHTRTVCDRVIEIYVPACDHVAFSSASAWLNEHHKGNNIFWIRNFGLWFRQLMISSATGQFMLWTLVPSVPAELFEHQVQVYDNLLQSAISGTDVEMQECSHFVKDYPILEDLLTVCHAIDKWLASDTTAIAVILVSPQQLVCSHHFGRTRVPLSCMFCCRPGAGSYVVLT
jgi:hypothetical protein